MKTCTNLLTFLAALFVSGYSISQTVSFTSSGGLYSTEKWISITTSAGATGTVVWAQGNGTQGNASGLLTNESIDLSGYSGQTLFLNAFDKYDDTWDGTVYVLRDADGVAIINNFGLSPTDGADTDASSGWDGTIDELETSEPFVVPAATYCSAVSATVDEYIAQVDFLNISNSSGTSTYTDYTQIISDPIAVGETHPINIVNGSTYNGDQLGIWIDWNKDMDFDDADETITVSGGPAAWTANITVPASVPAGTTTTRMRIRIMYTGTVSSCGSTTWGEVEDYTITIVGESPCSGTPTGGTASLTASDNCAATSGSLSVTGFESGTSGLSYDWETSANGTSGWTSTGVSASSGLSANPASTLYYRYVTTCSYSSLTGNSTTSVRTVATITAGSDVTRCGTGTVDLTASTNDGSVNWYAASSGGSSLSSGNTYSPSISSSTTYYAASTGCTGTRVAVAGTVNAIPTSVSVTGGAICSGGSTITASGGTGGTIYWQGTSLGGTSTSGGSGTTSPAITSAGTYYARAENNNCWGTEGSAEVTITTAPDAVSVTGGGSICANATLSASGGTNGTIYWQGTTSGGTSTGGTSGATSPVITSAGTYYARAENNDCWSTQGSAVVSALNAAPTAAAGDDVAFCNGGSSVLSGSGSVTAPAIPSGYAACYATSASDTYISNVTFNSIGATTGANVASVETDNTGTVISVNAGSSYSLSITTADPGGTAYTHGIAAFIDWNRDGDFADANETVYTTSSEVAVGTVSTTVTVPAGASEGDMMLRVVANEGSTAPSSTGTYSWGETEKYTVRVNPVLTYAWTPDVVLDNAAIAAPTTSTTSTRTYTLTVTALGCTGTDDVIATVYENPVAGTLTADKTETITASELITWSNSGYANGVISYSYAWGTLSNTTPPVGGYSNNWINELTLPDWGWSGNGANDRLWVKSTITSNNGCLAAESDTMYVDIMNCNAGAISASITVGPGTVADIPYSVSNATSSTIQYAIADVSNAIYEYAWSDNPTFWQNAGSATSPWSWSPDIANQAGKTLTVRGYASNVNGEGCAEYTPNSIVSNIIDCDATMAGITNNESGSATQITCTNTGISVTAINGDTYTWSDGSSTDAARIFTAADTYIVTASYTNGCPNTTSSITVTLNNTAPSVSLTNNESGSETEVTCVNTDINVTAGGADTYTWSDGSSTDATRDLSSAATYTVTGTETATGCTNTAQIAITLNNTAPTVVASNDASLCSGSSATLTSSGAVSYSWDNAAGSTSSVSVSPVSQTTYTVTGTGSNGCTATDDVVITVDVAPVITSSSTVTGSTTCGEKEINVVVSATSGDGVWSNTGQGLFNVSTDASTLFQSNTFGADMTLTWTQSAGACSGETAVITAKFNQPTAPGTSVYDYVWGGLTSTDWSTASNWYKWDGQKWLTAGSAPNAADCKVNIVAPDAMCVGTNPAAVVSGTVGDLTIGSSGTMNLGSSTLLLSGNLINNGTLNGSSGTIQVLASTGDQTISGNAMTFAGLTVNKQTSGALIMEADIAVTTLTMTKGNILNSALLTLGSGSDDLGTLSRASGIITGEFRRYFPNGANSSQSFPIGTASDLRDVSVNFPSSPGTDQYLTASYVEGAPTLSGGGSYEGLPLIAADGQLITNYDNEGHWVINPTGDAYDSDINLKAYSISLHMNNIADATDYTKARIIKSAGSTIANQSHLSWAALTNQSVSGSNSDFTLTAESTGFSFFGGGSDTGDNLPVELVSFNGSCTDGVVELNWETASEYNSSHYEVENSRDGITWTVVATKAAAGNSTQLLSYNYTDVNAHGGENYYRLKQVDIDGTEKTYDVINVSCSQTTAGYFSIFPNPSSGSFQVILNNSDIIGSAEMNMVDTKGNVVFVKSVDVKNGINMYMINKDLAPGIYYVSVKNGNKTTIVLKHSVQ